MFLRINVLAHFFLCNNSHHRPINTSDTCSPFDSVTCSTSFHWSEQSLDSGSSLTDLSHLTLDLCYWLKACSNLGTQLILTSLNIYINVVSFFLNTKLKSLRSFFCTNHDFFLLSAQTYFQLSVTNQNISHFHASRFPGDPLYIWDYMDGSNPCCDIDL